MLVAFVFDRSIVIEHVRVKHVQPRVHYLHSMCSHIPRHTGSFIKFELEKKKIFEGGQCSQNREDHLHHNVDCVLSALLFSSGATAGLYSSHTTI